MNELRSEQGQGGRGDSIKKKSKRRWNGSRREEQGGYV